MTTHVELFEIIYKIVNDKELAGKLCKAIENYIDEKYEEKSLKKEVVLMEKLKNELATKSDIQLIKKDIDLVRRGLVIIALIIILANYFKIIF
jgi:hypothetical protein